MNNPPRTARRGCNDDQVRTAIGHELRRMREAHGWTREQLAEKVPPLQKHTIYTYESGLRNCTLATFVALCDVLEVPAAVLLARVLYRARFENHMENFGDGQLAYELKLLREQDMQ